MSGNLPHSDALSEAGSGPESIAELLSRDPFLYSQQDLDRLVSEYRKVSEAWKVADAAGAKRPTAPKAPLTNKTTQKIEDLF